MTHPKPVAPAKTHLRCATPDCEWGTLVPSWGAGEIDRCRGKFREHCIERHGLDPNDTGRLAWFDLEALTLKMLG